MKKTVAVLMSTYNGEKYLREQLDSILAQEGVEVALFVRDDGSPKEETRKILREYEGKYKRIHCDYAENVGVGNSFMNLVYNAPAVYDYYAFSDQDDIWLPEKLSEAVKVLEESGKALYASNQECVDKTGKSMGLRYVDDFKPHLTPNAVVSRNQLAGCTMVMTNELFLKLSKGENHPSEELLRNRIHDVWVASVATVSGGIVYDKRSFMRYRQHENNVVGAYEGGFFKKLKNKIKKLKDPSLRGGRSKLCIELCEKFPVETREETILHAFATADKAKGRRTLYKHADELISYTGEGKSEFKLKVQFKLV